MPERLARWRPWLSTWWPVSLLVVGAVWCVLPMYDVPWWASHENIWYPVRVHEYLEGWHAGAWYPRWCPNLYGGYGYPFLDFYAPGVYFGGATLGTLTGLDPIGALKLLMVLVTIVGAVGSYGAILGEVARRDAAFVGAALYVFLPYRCTDLFARGDLAEYSAYCLVPLVVWGYRAIGRHAGRLAVVAACGAALAHAGVLMTHTLVGMFTTEIVGLYVLAQLWRGRSQERKPGVLGLGAMLLGIGVAGVYVIPAFFERRWVFIERITGDRFKSWLNMVEPAQLTDPFFTPGLPFAVAAVAWLVSLALPRTREGARRAAWWWASSLALFAILLPPFAWLWKILPFGAEVQFPWRLLGYIGLFAAFGLGVWWAHVVPATRRRGLVAAIVIAAPMPRFVTEQRRVAPEREVPLTIESIRDEFGTSTAMNEYLPRAVKVDPPRPRTRHAWAEDPEDPDVVVRSREVDGLHHAIELETTKPTAVTLAVFAFRGWHLRTLDGPPGAKLRVKPREGLLQIHVSQPGHYRFEVYFGQTPLRITASLVTLVSLLVAWPLFTWLRRRFLPGDVARRTHPEGASEVVA